MPGGAVLRRGDREAYERQFEEIVRRTSGRLRHIAFLLSGSWVDAEDLTQMTFLKAYRYLDRVCTVDAPDAYLKQILVRTCIDEARKRRIAEYSTDSVPESAVVDDENEEKWVVRRALAKVSQSQREILVLRYYADLSVEETARILRCSAGNVKSQTSRGLAALQRHLTAAEAADPSAS
jgi:RNA polymerase sigma-70 factor (sigma-E family)